MLMPRDMDMDIDIDIDMDIIEGGGVNAVGGDEGLTEGDSDGGLEGGAEGITGQYSRAGGCRLVCSREKAKLASAWRKSPIFLILNLQSESNPHIDRQRAQDIDHNY